MKKRMKSRDTVDEISSDLDAKLFGLDCIEHSFEEMMLFMSIIDEVKEKI